MKHDHDRKGFSLLNSLTEPYFEKFDPTPCDLYDGDQPLALQEIMRRASIGYDISEYRNNNERFGVDDFFSAMDKQQYLQQAEHLAGQEEQPAPPGSPEPTGAGVKSPDKRPADVVSASGDDPHGNTPQ